MNNIFVRAWSCKLGMSESVPMKDIINSDFEEFDKYMLYSGINDCKGNKIFEGDIVKIIDAPDSNYEKTYITEIVYKNGCFWSQYINNESIPLFYITKSKYYSKIYNPAIIEVIGNIYENKELLEGVNNE